MVGGVDLLHFDLRVYVAVIHKVHIGSFDLEDKEMRCKVTSGNINVSN